MESDGIYRPMAKSEISIRSLSDRIRSRIDDLKITHGGLTATSASLRAGLSRGAISDILSGKNQNPSLNNLQAIAAVLETDLEYLIGKRETPDPGGRKREVGELPVVGTVEAGVFREMSGPEPWMSGEHELERIAAPRSRIFPSARHFAFKVRGDSMNAASPKPILEGEYALFVDLVSADIGVVDGKIYLVRRTVDAGQTFEWTLKRARLYRNRVDLVPESKNQSHQVVTISREQRPDGEALEIEAVGLLYGTFSSFEQ